MTADVRIIPEHFWRDVWHENCASSHHPAPMRHLRERHLTPGGACLRLYECAACGQRVFAGVDEWNHIVTVAAAAAPAGDTQVQP